MGVFLRDPGPYLREFRKKNNGKLHTSRSTNETGHCTRDVSFTSLESRTAPPLVGQEGGGGTPHLENLKQKHT